jgi:hypothetical protein
MTASDLVAASTDARSRTRPIHREPAVRGGDFRSEAESKGRNRLNGQQNILNIFNCLRRITLKG